MINFKNAKKIKRRVTKHTVEEGDFFTISISCNEKEKLAEDNKDGSDEENLVVFLGATLCDEKGKGLDLSLEELFDIPDALFQDMIKVCMNMVTGEKKS